MTIVESSLINMDASIQVLLDNYRNDMMKALADFKNPEYPQHLRHKIEWECKKKNFYESEVARLEKQVCVNILQQLEYNLPYLFNRSSS